MKMSDILKADPLWPDSSIWFVASMKCLKKFRPDLMDAFLFINGLPFIFNDAFESWFDIEQIRKDIINNEKNISLIGPTRTWKW